MSVSLKGTDVNHERISRHILMAKENGPFSNGTRILLNGPGTGGEGEGRAEVRAGEQEEGR